MSDSRYMKSNSLNFIKMAKKTATIKPYDLNTFENKLFSDFNFKNKLNTPYCQKFLQDSNLWFQFQSEDATIKVERLHNGTTTIITSYASIVKTANGVNWWQIKPNITAYLGDYQIIVTFSDETFISEKFEVQETYNNISIIKWKGDDTYGYSDGIYWNDTQEMVIDAEIIEFGSPIDKTILNDTNNQIINIDSEVSAIDTLSVYKIPYYIKEKFLLGLAHYYFEVNGIEYQTKDSPEIEQMGKSLFYKGEIKLQRVNYNNE